MQMYQVLGTRVQRNKEIMATRDKNSCNQDLFGLDQLVKAKLSKRRFPSII